MQTITEFMSDLHNACDEAFVIAEQAALSSNWNTAETAFNNFRSDINKHIRMEKMELFPAIASSGGPTGPIQMMCMEHDQMFLLIEQMANALVQHDAQEYGGLSETLLILMQQHNLKEEQILYPIADQLLATQREVLFDRMRAA